MTLLLFAARNSSRGVECTQLMAKQMCTISESILDILNFITVCGIIVKTCVARNRDDIRVHFLRECLVY